MGSCDATERKMGTSIRKLVWADRVTSAGVASPLEEEIHMLQTLLAPDHLPIPSSCLFISLSLASISAHPKPHEHVPRTAARVLPHTCDRDNHSRILEDAFRPRFFALVHRRPKFRRLVVRYVEGLCGVNMTA